MAQDPYRYFRIEARELAEQLGRGFLDLEKPEAAAGWIPRLLRTAHTLKGAARVVKQAEIAEQAHAIEDALIPFREVSGALPRQQIDPLLKLLDRVNQCLANLTDCVASGPTAAASAPAQRNAPVEAQTVRADLATLDTVLEGLSEVHVQIDAMHGHLSLLEDAGHRVSLLVEQTNAWRRRHLGQSHIGPTQSIAEDLRATLSRLERGVKTSLERMERELRDARERTEQLRLVPAAALLTQLERSARDAAELLGRSVRFETSGGDIRLDGQVLDAVQGALHQLVRNAVAHGIEPPAARAHAGKPPAGRICVTLTHAANRLLFRCEDDGAGVDLEAVRRLATRHGLIPANADELSAQDLLQTLLNGGISTAGALTQVAGRGIGLEIVRTAADALGGYIQVKTIPGKGTALELNVPASVAAVDALIVESGNRRAGIPLQSVRHTLRIACGGVTSGAQGHCVIHEGQAIPFVPLARVMHWDTTQLNPNRSWSAAIVQGVEGSVAIGVERLCGTEGILLRPLSKLIPPLQLVSGAFLDAQGNAQIVLDPNGLVRAATAMEAAAPRPTKAARRVLVVDDSLTTRMLEQSILESAGFEVDTATSAEEALEAAALQRYALFLVDVEMPGMDGFSFIERYRAEASLRDIPAILVTSRNSPEDRRRGEAVGARGYMVKSDFDQVALLEHIERLVS